MAQPANRLGRTATLPFFGVLLLLAGFFLPWLNVAPLLDDPSFILESAGPAATVILPQGLEGDVRGSLNTAAASFGLATPLPEQFTPPQLISFAQQVEAAVNDPPPLVRLAMGAAGQAPTVPERAWMLNVLWVIPATAGLGLLLCLVGRRPRVTPLPGALLAIVVIGGVLYTGATYQGPTGVPVLGLDGILAVQGIGAWVSLVGGLLVIAGALRRSRTPVA